MTTLLRIDSSSRRDGSYSRRMGDALTARLRPDLTIARDLARDTVPHLEETAIAAFFTDPDQHTLADKEATKLSDQLIDDLMAADDVLITVPMYNFGIPSALKAWIDHVVRVGQTFSFDDTGFAGLLQGKRAFVVIAYGADGYTDGAFQSADFVAPYMTFVLNFIGISDVTIVPVEGVNVGREAAAEARAHAVISTVTPRAIAA